MVSDGRAALGRGIKTFRVGNPHGHLTQSWGFLGEFIQPIGAQRGQILGEGDKAVFDFMIQDLVKWFKAEYGEQFGGIRCEEILAGNNQNKTVRCPLLVSGVFQKVKELLVENGYDLSGLDE
jgi:hypothetical protein